MMNSELLKLRFYATNNKQDYTSVAEAELWMHVENNTDYQVINEVP